MEEIGRTLDEIRDVRIEASPTIIDKIKQLTEDIVLEDSDDAYIFIDPENESYIPVIGFDTATNRTTISIPSSTFSTKQVTFIGETYHLHFVDGNGIESGISFDREQKKIYVNVFSTDIMNYSISFLDVLLIVEYAYKTSDNHHEMRETILHLLGGDYNKVTDVYTNLCDNID